MKVEVYTLCWNEMDVLPWVIDYWKRYATHVTVFDNISTDGSTQLLGGYDWIDVVMFESGGLNDTENQRIKNNCWKGSQADFVVVCDMDECLLARDIMETLRGMKEQGATICRPRWYELLSDNQPEYKEGQLLHEISPVCYPDQKSAKVLIFDPNAIKEINYTPGAHSCKPIGNVRWYKGDDLFTLHINHNLGLEYKLNRYRTLNARLSDVNKRKKYGIHYAFTEDFLRKEWQEKKRQAVNINNII